MRLGWEIALLTALDMLETFSRHDFGLVLAGIRKTTTGRNLDRLIDRWRQQQIITRTGRGRNARFRIMDGVLNRMRESDPAAEWGRYWDGKWRVFSFDLPGRSHKGRMGLWRNLRRARFGFLQRSVWIWPHEVEEMLLDMVEAKGIPECFCGFEVSRLFLCETAEIVASAWEWERIRGEHDDYIRNAASRLRNLRATNRLESLSRIARVERAAYADVFRHDPLLPRDLWPDSYRGPAVRDLHLKIEECLRDRFRGIVSAQ
jgi:DNA-binding transcriptional regulator PaaX